MSTLNDAERPTVIDHASAAVGQAGSPGDYAVLRWLVLATFVVILNETIMINAIPRLMGEFDVTRAAAQWLSTAFMLTMAVVIPVTGWFLQRVTTRQAFAIAMAVFCAGTLLAAVAPAFAVLLAARVVQAAGTAVMMPLLMTTLMTIVPEHDRGRVMGNVMLAISVAPALGPAVSGVVLQFASPGAGCSAWCCRSPSASPSSACAGSPTSASRDAGRHRLVSASPPPRSASARSSTGSAGSAPATDGAGHRRHRRRPASPWSPCSCSASCALQRAGAPLLDLRTLTPPHLHGRRCC